MVLPQMTPDGSPFPSYLVYPPPCRFSCPFVGVHLLDTKSSFFLKLVFIDTETFDRLCILLNQKIRSSDLVGDMKRSLI